MNDILTPKAPQKNKTQNVSHTSHQSNNDGRLRQFQRGELIFNVIDQGPLDGEPIVLLHGFPEMANSWQAVSEILNSQGFRTYALEQRGYSMDARPRGRFQYSLNDLTSDLDALIEIIDQPVYLVGHDWGSLVTCEYALHNPQKVNHLTLVSVPHKGAYVQAMLTSSQFFSSYYVAFFQLPVIPEIMFKHIPKLRQFFLKNSGMTDEQIQSFEQEFIQEGRLSTAIHWYRSIILNSPFDTFKTVSVPTLFVWGDQDIAIGKKCADLNRKFFSHAYEDIYLKATHWIPTQNAEALSQAILNAIKTRG